MADIRAIAEQLVGLTIKEANELAKVLEEDYGIKPAAAAIAMAAPAATGGGDPAPVEKTEFDVILSSSGAQKLNVVKVVKDLLGLGLKEAKDLVDAAPSTLKTAVSKADAEDMQKKLSEAGATVEVK